MRSKDKTRRIPRSKWAIPLPKWAKNEFRHKGDTTYGMAYEDAEGLLESLGFERIFSRVGHSLSDLRFMRPGGEDDRPQEVRALWAHPAGIFANLDSYRMTAPQQGPLRRKLSSLSIDFELDSGSFRGNYKKTSAATRQGSGGTTPLLHGCNSHHKSFRVGSHGDRGLLSLLEEIQAHAKFRPFEQWTHDSRLYIPQDFMFCPVPDPADYGSEVKVLQEKYQPQIKAAFEQMKASLSPPLGELVRAGLFGSKIVRMHDRDWHKVEDTIDYYLRTLEAAGVCWPKARDIDLLNHWSLRIADYQAPNNWETDRIADSGPGGINYASALLSSIGRSGNETRFVDLLRSAPEDQLRSWATQQDCLGLTLVSQIAVVAGNLTHATCLGLRDCAADMTWLEKSLDTLVDRLGPGQLSLGSEQTSLASMIRKIIDERDGDVRDEDLMMIDRMVSIIEHALEIGIAWGPNSHENEQDFNFLRQSCANRGAIGRFASMWERHQLALGSAPSPRPARPGGRSRL